MDARTTSQLTTVHRQYEPQSFKLPLTTDATMDEVQASSKFHYQTPDISETSIVDTVKLGVAPMQRRTNDIQIQDDPIVLYNESGNRVTGPYTLEPYTLEIKNGDFMEDLVQDESLSYDSSLKIFFEHLTPPTSKGIVLKTFTSIPETPSKGFVISNTKELDRSITTPQLNDAVVCFINMIVYTFRELLLFLPPKGSMVHEQFAKIINKEWIEGKNPTYLQFKCG